MKFTNPVTGDWAMPTISTCMQLLPAGFATKPYRSTDGTIFSIIEGHGRSEIGSEIFAWRAKDTFVVPSWTPVRHFPESEAVVFSFSDRAIQEKLGIWREQRGELPS